MEFDTNRRRFLQLSGASAALSLAGCSSPQNKFGSSESDSSSSETVVSVVIQPDQKKLQEVRSNITSDLRSGNITRQEAQQKLQNTQTELQSKAITKFKDRASSVSNLTVTDSAKQFGAVLVSGSPEKLIQTLTFETVRALLPKAKYHEAKSRLTQSGNTTST